jgi:hypothetical protein
MAFTTADLLSAIGRRSFAPTGQTTFTSAEQLAVADEVLLNRVFPEIAAIREEFFVTEYDYAITASKNAYKVHARSFAATLRDVYLVKGDTIVTDFPRIEPNDARTAAEGSPEGFYLKDDYVVVAPTPNATENTLRQVFLLTPSKHVAVSAAAVISAINTGTGVVTVTTIPSTWATGNAFDFIAQDGNHRPVAIDQTSTLVSGSTITFASLPSTLRVGDYVALAGETPVVQVPDVYRAALAQGVAAQILEDMNQPGADKASKRFEIMLDSAKRLLTPRVQGEDRVVVPVNWF